MGTAAAKPATMRMRMPGEGEGGCCDINNSAVAYCGWEYEYIDDDDDEAHD